MDRAQEPENDSGARIAEFNKNCTYEYGSERVGSTRSHLMILFRNMLAN